MNSPYGIIYKATNLLTNKIYIGQTIKSINERRKSHLYSARTDSPYKFHKAIRKYGSKQFKWEIVDEGIDHIQLNRLEEFYIIKHDCVENGYNTLYKIQDTTFKQSSEFRKKLTDLSDEEASIVKCLNETENLTQTEIRRLTNISPVIIRNIVLNLGYDWVKSSSTHPFTKEQIHEVKQQSIDIKIKSNNNRPDRTIESKSKIIKFSDETIADILWFLENTDMTSPELSEMFNYSNMSDLRNNKTRTWVKASKSVSKELLEKAEKIKNNRSKNDLKYKISIIKKIMNDKLLNQSQCSKIVEISQPLVSIIVLKKDHVDIEPIDNLPDFILDKIEKFKNNKLVHKNKRTDPYLTEEYKKFLDKNPKTSRAKLMKVLNVTEHLSGKILKEYKLLYV